MKWHEQERTSVDQITVNGVTYYSQPSKEYAGELKIVILQRGWVLIGRLERNENECKLHKASVIRRWGTDKGLGQLAVFGPQKETVLDKCYGVVEFHYLTVVATISVNEEKWTQLE